MCIRDRLNEGETLSAFVEESLRAHINQRLSNREFIARGLASRDAASQSGQYYSSDDVLKELDEILADAQERPSI